ncbi:hypothetical protein DL765_000452 [Monosporascus sp. GIB2]|nr:hypothetical protein DL765_000452 [Monosporascus sp. GIB2]
MNTDSFEYIIVGGGHGGGPLASNLARAGCSTLLIDAGDKEIVDPPNNVGAFFALTGMHDNLHLDFWVKQNNDLEQDLMFNHDTLEAAQWRPGTASHTHRRGAFKKLENDTYLHRSAPRHGFDGYLDVTTWDGTQYTASKHAADILQVMVAEIPRTRISGPSLSRLILTTLVASATSPRVSCSHLPNEHHTRPIRRPRPHSLTFTPGYPLTVQTNSLATKALFSTMGATPRPIDVELLEGKRVYKGDPWPSLHNVRQEQGHHVRLPHGSAPPTCTRGVMADPCYDPWLQGGDPNTHAGPNTISMLKSNHTVDSELDPHAFSSPFAHPGFRPTKLKQTRTDPPNSWGIMTIKIYPQNENSTNTARSADPTNTPPIYFRRFTQGADVNVPAMKEVITWGRSPCSSETWRAMIYNDIYFSNLQIMFDAHHASAISLV